MSHLSRLIEQARRTRRVNDIFNFQPAVGRLLDADAGPDNLLTRLTELELCLFHNPTLAPLLTGDLAGGLATELEKIAAEL